MKLSKDFDSSEFESPDSKTIPSEQLTNLRLLIINVLQPLRDAMKSPVTITSGYRTSAHNKAVGGVSTSHHLKGMAADIVTVDNKVAFEFIKHNCLFTQLIDEHDLKWIHVSFDMTNLKKQVLKLS